MTNYLKHKPGSIEEITAKIYAVRKEIQEHKFNTGKIIASKKELKVAIKDGFLIIDEIKISGKKKMDAKSLLNGYTFSEDAEML